MYPIKRILFFLFLLPIFCHGQIITTIAGNGTAGYSGDGSSALSAEFNQPTSVRFDHSGNMYIADWMNNVVRKINTHGIISTIAGNGFGAGIPGVAGYKGDGGPATAAELDGPVDIAFDAAGNIYIDDEDNSVIRKVDALGIITTFAGTGVGGYNGDGIQATDAELFSPIGLSFDNAGNLYFSDSQNRIVRKISPAGIITTIAGNGTNGDAGDGGPATSAQLREPCWLSISKSGDIYIPDMIDHRVRKINMSGIITTVAGNGTAGDSGDGGPATSASIGGCQAIVFDNSGNFFISNISDCSIRKIDVYGIINTVVGNDTCGYSGDGGQATAAKINVGQVCSAVDASGNLYIADNQNSRIRRVTYDATSVKEITIPVSIVSIFPNPATTSLTITSTNKITNITITNLLGQTVYTHDYNANNMQVDVAGLPAGVYFIKINGTEVRRFVKE